MLSDTIDINKALNEFNVLLDNNEKYNSKNHIKNLLKAKKTLMNKSELNDFEKELLEVIDEIFTNLI
jgi:hypothetical protein